VLRTDTDSRLAVRLPGGVSLRLDTGSSARLTSAYSIALRQGALYVDTGSPAGVDRGLEIHTPWGRVTENGTQFDVRLSGDSMSLRVRDGSASLNHRGRAYMAAAGERLLIDGGGTVVLSDIARHGEEWSWTLGVAPSFDLEGRSLQDFLRWVSNETGWRVEYEEKSIAERAPGLVLHGSIEGMRPDEAPGAVLPACGLRHQVVEGTLLVGRL
jgi:ferric-dicitrate binding protein FerR (iron transport regulator)